MAKLKECFRVIGEKLLFRFHGPGGNVSVPAAVAERAFFVDFDLQVGQDGFGGT